MKRKMFHLPLVLAALLGILLVGCGGGGGGTSGSGASLDPAAPTLSWDPPTTYSDNSVMNPYLDLDYYEIYIRTADENFTDNDVPVAQVAALYNQVLISDFALSNLLPFTQSGVINYLSIKSVSVTGLKSNFSIPVIWDLT